MPSPEHLDPALWRIAEALTNAVEAAGLPHAEIALERPKAAEHGDWATSVALRLAKPAKRAPYEIAEAILGNMSALDDVAELSVAGAGFINIRLSNTYFADLIDRVLVAGESFGQSPVAEKSLRINVEFVSANPTGPLHVGAGRWAATGDAIAALLTASGNTVTREYYVNDAGEQIRRFGASIALAGRNEECSEEHYQGAVIGEIAQALEVTHGSGVFQPSVDVVAETVGELGVAEMRRRISEVLATMGVSFDRWFSEQQDLHALGAIDEVITWLTEQGHCYVDQGAVFLKTSLFGDEKDRVVRRSDGRPTYFAADCAYMRDKWLRSDHLFYLLGADHHGYVARLKAVAACLAIPGEHIEIRIGQLVNLLRDGVPVRMSKRAGETIDLDEVLDEVGSDVLRYHFLRQSLDTTVDFDLAVVTQQSMENPVYYVQYAHARISSLLRAAQERGFDPGTAPQAVFTGLTEPAERALLAALAQMPLAVAEAAEHRATQRLARYAEELAGTFHRFYAECRILDALDPSPQALVKSRARYWLAYAARDVLRNTLALLRVSAPDRM